MKKLIAFFFGLTLSINLFAQFEIRLNPLIPWGMYSEFEYGIVDRLSINAEADFAFSQNGRGGFQTGISYVGAGVPPFDFNYEYSSPITLGISGRFYLSANGNQNKGFWVSAFTRSTFIRFTSEEFAEDVSYRRHSVGGRLGVKWLLGQHFVIDAGAGLGWLYRLDYQDNEFGDLLDRFNGKPLNPITEFAVLTLGFADYFSGGRLLDEERGASISRLDPTIRLSIGYRF